ncbi:MAG: FHA domain-containing protein [Aggregatilineales bacterium]
MTTATLDWDVELNFDDPPQSVHVMVERQVLLGRTPNNVAEMPGFDLSPYNAAEKGVSRRHGMLVNDGAALSYSDLGSDNGTVFNGRRLSAQETVRLNDGDVLYMGHLKVTVTLKSRVRKTSIAAIRPGLTLSSTPISGKGQRILIVEDETGLAQMYRLGLERNGYTVQTVREMVSAIRTLNRVTPSAIIVDLMLPGINGLELCRYVRRDTECPSIPIAVVSALHDSENVKAAMDSGADIYMTKPLDWRELVRVISSLVQQIEVAQPLLHTKKLNGTARLDFIPATTRADTLVVFVDGHREPFTAVAQPQITMGRQASDPNTATAHIDLESYSAFDKGVSRMHLTIRRVAKGFDVEDLDSANGTFVNGFSLAPHAPHQLKNGDELRLGDLRMHVYFLAETEVAER